MSSASDDVKFAILEERFLQLAKQIGIVESRQDEFSRWVHEHEKKEMSHHVEVMQATASMTASLKTIETDIQRAKEQANSSASKRKDAFDRVLRVLLALVVLAGAGSELVKFIGQQYNQPVAAPEETPASQRGKR